MQIERVALEGFERDVLEDVLVRGFEHHLRRHAGLVRLDPAQHVQAPPVPGLEALEAHLRARRGEIVAARTAELEKLRGRLDADQVRDPIHVVRRAASVAEEPGERRVAAGEQGPAEDVFFLGEDGAHGSILTIREEAVLAGHGVMPESMPPVTLLAAHPWRACPRRSLVKVELKITRATIPHDLNLYGLHAVPLLVKAQQIGNAGRFSIDGTYHIAIL